jgi:hypothetical protein
VCLQCEGKGESGSLGSTLNSNRERERERESEREREREREEAEGASGGPRLPLKAAGISGRSGGKGKKPDFNASKYRLNWRARRVGRGKEAAGRGGNHGGG